MVVLAWQGDGITKLRQNLLKNHYLLAALVTVLKILNPLFGLLVTSLTTMDTKISEEGVSEGVRKNFPKVTANFN